MTGPSTDEWTRFYSDGIYYAEHRGGVSWYDAPVPRRWHRCRPQNRAYFAASGYVERCACGAIRGNFGPWAERNSRLRLRKRNPFAR